MVNSFSFSSGEYREFRKKIQHAHINLLRSYSSVLVSDTVEKIMKDGEVLETMSCCLHLSRKGQTAKSGTGSLILTDSITLVKW
ncbi:MAG: hypothetical protein R2727_06595 [Bacteroidales bacterium]